LNTKKFAQVFASLLLEKKNVFVEITEPTIICYVLSVLRTSVVTFQEKGRSLRL